MPLVIVLLILLAFSTLGLGGADLGGIGILAIFMLGGIGFLVIYLTRDKQ